MSRGTMPPLGAYCEGVADGGTMPSARALRANPNLRHLVWIRQSETKSARDDAARRAVTDRYPRVKRS
ncbi:MAG: hypothetical protein AMXMBFR4_13820 [Candidatus Hydrogenedentota bacterium]